MKLSKMIQLERSSRFNREYKKFIKNNLVKAKSFLKTLNIFRNNPKHPSLNCEKLLNSNIWTMRIDKANRIFFTWINKNTVLLIDIGKHDKYRRY